jgi:heterodisulfide reductase subunit A-like polyferredoxin
MPRYSVELQVAITAGEVMLTSDVAINCKADDPHSSVDVNKDGEIIERTYGAVIFANCWDNKNSNF